jgi:hypothetical protein
MALENIYSLKPEGLDLRVQSAYDTVFNFKYSDDRDDLLSLYEKGKRMQWDAQTRIDWSQELGVDDPMQGPQELHPLYGMDLFMKMNAKERRELFWHHQAWSNSQFLHGEQGALLCAAKIVQTVPDLESKFYAASQVADEARHVEAYKRLVEKFGMSYPITPPLQSLLEQVVSDSRWDMTYLGMQVVIEGLALAAFAGQRDHAQNPLIQQVNTYVMQDEARHVAFGRLALRAYYPQLSQSERNEREEFLVEACYLMRDRFEIREVWQNLGLPVEKCVAHVQQSEGMRHFRNFLFNRIVPVVRDIGLWGPRVVKAYSDMGVLHFADLDLDDIHAKDEQAARDMDARRAHMQEVATIAAE